MEIIGLEEDVRAIALTVLETASEALMSDLIDAAPVDTGELQNSAEGPEIDPEQLSAVVRFTAPQADWTDQGVEDHDIFPRGPGYPLRFYWADGPDGPGEYTFDSVHHPGQEGTHWFSDRIDEWQTYVDEAADNV